MDTNRLDDYFEDWIKDKEVANSINNVYGQSGLMAIVNFILFVKDKEHECNSYRKSYQRGQADYSRTRLRA